jgi:hypothetical protein
MYKIAEAQGGKESLPGCEVPAAVCPIQGVLPVTLCRNPRRIVTMDGFERLPRFEHPT